ncbi:MAG: Gmad2 immunoglobulin-like domain-containing protein [Gaiellaceae bacterium]
MPARARGAICLAMLLAGCGGADESSSPATSAPPPPPMPRSTVSETQTRQPEQTALSVYFLRDGQIAAARRTVAGTEAVARAALEALIDGPTAREREAGLVTSVSRGLAFERLEVADGAARVDFSGGRCPSIAQVVYTLTQFSTVQRVTGNCIPDAEYPQGLARADLEDVTPPIFVESPTVHEEVSSPVRIRGTANTFEAVFVVNLTDWDGRIVAEQIVTATSGSGDRGTFDVTVPFEVDRPGGALVVFERSAEDGSQIHVIEIPLRLKP